MIDKSRLEQKCSTWNITLTGTQLDQLDAFAQILVEYNQKVNLTAITTRRASRTSISSIACSLRPSPRWRGRWWTSARAQASRAS